MYWHWNPKAEVIQEVPEPLPRCAHCGIHMPVACMFKHRRIKRCIKAAEMCIRRRDVEM